MCMCVFICAYGSLMYCCCVLVVRYVSSLVSMLVFLCRKVVYILWSLTVCRCPSVHLQIIKHNWVELIRYQLVSFCWLFHWSSSTVLIHVSNWFHFLKCLMTVFWLSIKVKVKVPILMSSIGSQELIPDSRQSACRWQHAWSWTQWWAATTSHQDRSDTHMHVMNPAVGCHYFPPGPQFFCQARRLSIRLEVCKYLSYS